MSEPGYYRDPTMYADTVVFVSEADLWQVPAAGGMARRLTANRGKASRPLFSPDGSRLAFTGREEGQAEIYVMPAGGGGEQRLTYMGGNSYVVGWNPSGESILFASNAAQPFTRFYALWEVDVTGGATTRLPYGLAHDLARGKDGGIVLGRNTGEPARWKRYRGGTAGRLWIDPDGSGRFAPLVRLPGNLTAPLWIGDRIYFLSDHEGIGNLYSVTPAGEDLQRHTDHTEFYARNASTDGKRIVYHAGGALYLFDPSTRESRVIEVDYRSPRTSRQRKFVSPGKYLEEYRIHPRGHALVTVHRGKMYTFANWEDAVEQMGEPDGVRYQRAQWLADGETLIAVSDNGGEEHLETYTGDGIRQCHRMDDLDLGRPLLVAPAPEGRMVALTNHRHEVILVDPDTEERTILDRSEFDRIQGLDWSPDGKWIAYSAAETQHTFSLKIVEVATGTIHRITPPLFRDIAPSFDPGGKYLYFLSYREFNPVYDSMYFDLNFPRGARPFLITLRDDLPSPFIPKPAPPRKSTAGSNNETSKESGLASEEFRIDFDGIEHRVVEFPIPEARYRQIWGVDGKVLFSSTPIKGVLDKSDSSTPAADAILEYYDFQKQKKEVVAKNVTGFQVSQSGESLVYRSKNRLRVIPIEPLKKHNSSTTPGRESGWIDLNRVKVSVDPGREWEQMFREIWRLQREHFWKADMSGVDWERVYQRYRPLLDRVTTRTEFSDLVWEMQGELGTSHAYELGGDYPNSPDYKLGFLGADFEYDESTDGYVIRNVVRGDPWKEDRDSPLHQVGAGIREGDILLAVNGQRVSRARSPWALLVNQSESYVNLILQKADSGEQYSVAVKTLKNETPARYRQWVERNKRWVHQATKGRVGYVHIPNMGARGYAEFHRYYLAEVDKESLIVDVRFNGGGHVSQLILEKLARERVGYDVQRWGKPEPYPADSVIGPMVAVTNEHAGSDGDIFSHCFKLMGLGTLIGTRTWGGVIGIFPRHALVDGSVTTQPEFSFWFKDVGWGVENYGTDPDVEIDITPGDYAEGRDPQLEKAVEIILARLQESPVRLPEFSDPPDRSLPT